MIYNTGTRDDWDYISRITADPAWSWDGMAPYRDLHQKYVAPNDGHDDVSQRRACSFLPPPYRSAQTNQYLPSAHSRNGMVSISLPGYSYPIDSKIIAAAAEPEFASELPFQRDMNAGNAVRLPTLALRRLDFDFSLGFGHRSALAGFKVPLPTAGAPARPPPTLDRSTLIARTCTSWLTLRLRSFSKQPALVPRSLPSMGSSLEQDPLVSRYAQPRASFRLWGGRPKVAGDRS